MVCAGASLSEVGQVLTHAQPMTTAIYGNDRHRCSVRPHAAITSSTTAAGNTFLTSIHRC